MLVHTMIVKKKGKHESLVEACGSISSGASRYVLQRSSYEGSKDLLETIGWKIFAKEVF